MDEEKKIAEPWAGLYARPWALVSGASSGIGLAISRELARLGYPVLLVSNEEEKLKVCASEIEKTYSVKAIHLYMDLAQKDSAGKVFDYCEKNCIEIKILVNCAGIFFFRDVTDTAIERIETMINLHILTPTLLCRSFAEKMLRSDEPPGRQKGYILNIASIAAWMMMPGLTFYNATKSYLRCFSRAMRNEVLDKGISITTICPGAVATGLYGLAPHLMKLGIRAGIILTPERLAAKVIKKMFRKKKEYIPGGLLNRFFIFIVQALPECLVRRFKRTIDERMSGARK